MLAAMGVGGCSGTDRPAAAPPAPHTAQAWVRPYPAAFGYGSNLGYYGPAWPDERFRRMWRYYLAGSMASFRTRRIQLWQVLMSPEGVPGGIVVPR